MRARRLLFTGVAVLCVLGVTAGLAAAAVSWGNAIQAPGTAALNVGGGASIRSVSCAGAAHNCSAGGYYTDGSNGFQALVASEKNGSWGNAIQVKGMTTLNVGEDAWTNSVSCGSAGNCAGGGFYKDKNGSTQAFVVSQKNWAWHYAAEVKGTAALNTGGDAWVTSVSCRGLPGNCSAGGFYTQNGGPQQAFVVNEKKGVWGTAIEVPGTAALNVGNAAEVNSVSCGSAGNCVAGGYYHDGSSHDQAFVATEHNGVWSAAIELPGTAALNVYGARVLSVSCSSAGKCSAGGFYEDAFGHDEPFVASETGGVWSNAIEVPNIETLNVYGDSQVTSLSCASTGNCSAGGYYRDQYGYSQPFVVDEANGVWGNAQALTVANAFVSSVTSVSCGTAGNCAAGGYYVDLQSYQYEAFVAAETSGTWGAAAEVPGTATLNFGAADLNSISCAKTGPCAIGGDYHDASYNYQAFVTSP